MTDEIKVGQLTKSFWKSSQRPEKITKTPAENFAETVDSTANLQELARRLSNLENQISLKVDSGKILSAIVLAEEALMITSDKIAVVGQTSFYDYVRDQNGTATGVIDPSMTLIRGGVIQTEQIIAGAWGPDTGSAFDLDNGNLIMGGSDYPKFEYINDNGGTATLKVQGNISVQDTFESNGTTLKEAGMFLTGDLGYTHAGGVTGSTGVAIGTGGIFGLKDSNIVFSFETGTGDAYFGGEIITDEFVQANGNNSTGFDIIFGEGTPTPETFNIYTSVWGKNDPDTADTVGRFIAGISGTSKASPDSTGRTCGVLGVVDRDDVEPDPNFENKYGVCGVAYQQGIGGLFYSSQYKGLVAGTDNDFGWTAFEANALNSPAGDFNNNSATFPTIQAENNLFDGVQAIKGDVNSLSYPAIQGSNARTGGGAGIIGDGNIGVLGQTTSADPNVGVGVYSAGVLTTSTRLEKEDKTKGVLKLFTNSGDTVPVGTYYYTFELTP